MARPKLDPLNKRHYHYVCRLCGQSFGEHDELSCNFPFNDVKGCFFTWTNREAQVFRVKCALRGITLPNKRERTVD